uniref:Uncharacterized protein n=1 Tax=Arundo donax TaxID=35708 RepID=A0A0A8Z3G3_ARUDO
MLRFLFSLFVGTHEEIIARMDHWHQIKVK